MKITDKIEKKEIKIHKVSPWEKQRDARREYFKKHGMKKKVDVKDWTLGLFGEHAMNQENDGCVFPPVIVNNPPIGEDYNCSLDANPIYTIKNRILYLHCDENEILMNDKIQKNVKQLKIPNDITKITVKCKSKMTDIPVNKVNEEAIRRASKIIEEKGGSSYFSNVIGEEYKGVSNVLILFYDAVSRAHFTRTMTSLSAFLEKMEFNGKHNVYHFFKTAIVGAYSPPNHYAMYSGAPFPDHQQFYEGSPFDKNKHQIDYSIPKEGRPEIFMWDVFKKKGYVTMKCIDMCPESYAYPSYCSRTPTDYFYSDIFCEKKYTLQWSPSKRCLLNKKAHKYLHEYLISFWENHLNLPKMAIVDHEEGHEPSMKILKSTDWDSMKLLEYFYENGYLDNTILLILSDHGIGYGSFRQTAAGVIEERNAYFTLVVPKKRIEAEENAEEIEKNLFENQQKVISMNDIYHVTMHLAQAPNEPKTVPDYWEHVGSLLNARPVSTTCQDVGVNMHACPCLYWNGRDYSETGANHYKFIKKRKVERFEKGQMFLKFKNKSS